jgi:hypothetical protein
VNTSRGHILPKTRRKQQQKSNKTTANRGQAKSIQQPKNRKTKLQKPAKHVHQQLVNNINSKNLHTSKKHTSSPNAPYHHHEQNRIAASRNIPTNSSIDRIKRFMPNTTSYHNNSSVFQDTISANHTMKSFGIIANHFTIYVYYY